MEPQLVHQSLDNCVFNIPLSGDSTDYNLSDYLISSLGIGNKPDLHRHAEKIGYAAILSHDWGVEQVHVQSRSGRLMFYCDQLAPRDSMAFPIDPRMTKGDIEGATKIFPNSTNDGWLFSHTDSDEHHDRMYELESVMVSMFQDVIDSKMQMTLAAVTSPPRDTRPVIGDSNTGTSRALYLQWNTLVEFRKECVKWVVAYEKLLHIGQHIQEGNFHINHQLVRAIEEAKKVWKRDKATDLASISAEVAIVEARIKSLHRFETRWDKLARQEAEAKKAAAEASSDSGSESEGS